jgi:TDG/mug DNA glycosylase family protein
VAPGLDVVFCGINPSIMSFERGHHFARPGNRFWPTLHGSGFTPRLMRPEEDMELLEYGVGVTNVVDRPTRGVADLTAEEMRDGGEALAEFASRFRPKVVAVLGVTAWRAAYKRPEAVVGLQPQTVGSCAAWVLPNPSGLNAHYQLPDLIRLFGELREWIGAAD